MVCLWLVGLCSCIRLRWQIWDFKLLRWWDLGRDVNELFLGQHVGQSVPLHWVALLKELMLQTLGLIDKPYWICWASPKLATHQNPNDVLSGVISFLMWYCFSEDNSSRTSPMWTSCDFLGPPLSSLDTSPHHDEVSDGEFPEGLPYCGVGLAQSPLGTRLSCYFFSILSSFGHIDELFGRIHKLPKSYIFIRNRIMRTKSPLMCWKTYIYSVELSAEHVKARVISGVLSNDSV